MIIKYGNEDRRVIVDSKVVLELKDGNASLLCLNLAIACSGHLKGESTTRLWKVESVWREGK